MSCATSTKNIESIKGFDSEKYLGKWYEIARFDHSFERGLDYVTATYTAKQNGKIKVLNEGKLVNGTYSSAEGKAFINDTPESFGELRVSFFLFFYAKYRIIYLDEDYQNAIVTSGTMNYLWILSRTPILSNEELEHLVNFCKEKGFDTSKLIFVKQA
ncbi:MAG: lipocalin family protein [Bacteroidales bacterium]|nr:lipocalin family protein [Bacteroidales bacterium]